MDDIYSQISTVQKAGTPAVFCLVTGTQGSTPRKAGSKMIVFPDKHISGTIGGGSVEAQAIEDALEILTTGSAFKKTYHLEEDLSMKCGGSMEVYFEPVGMLPVLYIFGAGHIGKVLARYACDFGFRITVFDERPGIFSEWQLSGVHCVEGDYLISIENACFDNNTFVVILTHLHIHDEKILGIVARKNTAYTGMIGSRKKVAEITHRLQERGALTLEEIKKTDMPIGIPMAAETPEEIAISILARLIDVKNTLKKS
jgi:xanthine dehydrogenase accessory factor